MSVVTSGIEGAPVSPIDESDPAVVLARRMVEAANDGSLWFCRSSLLGMWQAWQLDHDGPRNAYVLLATISEQVILNIRPEFDPDGLVRATFERAQRVANEVHSCYVAECREPVIGAGVDGVFYQTDMLSMAPDPPRLGKLYACAPHYVTAMVCSGVADKIAKKPKGTRG